jgi:Raf kinase inhibitor-like YbhB/YbcL family protein
MKVKSAFKNGEYIPKKYSCDGENINPHLEIFDIPEKTKTLAIIVEDPDAPNKTFTHWILFNVPIMLNELYIGEDTKEGIKGLNDLDKIGYTGPCPPHGEHKYIFRIFALDTELELEEGATKEEVKETMQKHILDQVELIGLFKKL